MNEPEFFSQLKAVGIDIDTALERFMGNQGLYVRFLLQLPEMLDFEAMRQSLEA